MKASCILVVDAENARIFSLESAPGIAGVPSLRLVEQKALVNPDRMMRGHELFTGQRSDASGHFNGKAYTLDDHRSAHLRESERKFAARAILELEAFMDDQKLERAVIVAGPRTLGQLREARAGHLEHKIISEKSSDLAGLSPSELVLQLEGALV